MSNSLLESLWTRVDANIGARITQISDLLTQALSVNAEAAADASATAAHRVHVDNQVSAIDTAFTESIPPYLQPGADGGLQEIYGRGVHVKTFGALGDGVADDTAAIQDAVSSGKVLYWGDTGDVYRVTAQINLRTTTPVVWNSDGARIVSETAEPTQRVFWIELQGNPISISGPLTIDANRNAYTCIYIANANDTAVPATIRDLTVLNPYRSAKAFTGGDGIALRGGFTTITLDRPVVKNVAMAPDAGTAGYQGVSGIAITALSPLRAPRDVVINAPFIDGVYDENTESSIDQDGIKVFSAEDVAGYLIPYETRFLISGGTIRNCGGRAVKSQTEWGVVDGVKIYRGQARAQGGTDIDFQVGGGQVTNISAQYEGNSPATVVNFSGPATSGKLVPHGSVSGLKVLASGEQSPTSIVTFNQRESTVSNVTVRDIEVVGNQPRHVITVNGVSDGLHSAIISEVYAAPTLALIRGAYGSPNGWTGSIIVSNCINTGEEVPLFESGSGELVGPQIHHSRVIGFAGAETETTALLKTVASTTYGWNDLMLESGLGSVYIPSNFRPPAGTYRISYMGRTEPFDRYTQQTDRGTLTPVNGLVTEIVRFDENDFFRIPGSMTDLVILFEFLF